MTEKSFIELFGESNDGIADALAKALSSNPTGTIDWYEIIETNSTTNDEIKNYRVRIKAGLEVS